MEISASVDLKSNTLIDVVIRITNTMGTDLIGTANYTIIYPVIRYAKTTKYGGIPQPEKRMCLTKFGKLVQHRVYMPRAR